MPLKDLAPRDHAAIEDYRLQPGILILGCQPFVRCQVRYATPPPINLKARRGELHERPDRRPHFVGYTTGDAVPCPACGDLVRDRPSLFAGDRPSIVICVRCSRMDARHDQRLKRSRDEADIARHGRDAASKAERELNGLARAAGRGRVQLSEVERRRLWCGNKHSMLSAHVASLTNLARAGRQFLTAINQPPNFDRILDARGKITGYWSTLERQAAELLARAGLLNVAPEDLGDDPPAQSDA